MAEHGAEQFAAGVVEALGGGQVGLGVSDRVQLGEGHAGLEKGVGVVERLERLVGRGDGLARIATADLAGRVAVLDREQAWAVVVEERRELALREVVDQVGVAPRDVVAAEVFAHDVAILALDEGVVVAVPGPRLGELDVQLVEQVGDAVVDVLGAVVGMDPLMAKGNRSIRPSSRGTGKRSEMARTAPTNSYCVTSSTTLIR